MTYVLMYHDVVARGQAERSGFPGPVAGRYKLDEEHFVRHLDAIAATGASVGLVGGDGGAPQCAITFDDGGATALTAAGLLEARGWRGHFFVTSSRIGTPGFLTATQVRELMERGHRVGSHSHRHPTYMGKLERSKIAEEWRVSREVLGGVLGIAPATASVPGGFLSRAVMEEAAAAGYEVLMTSEPTARLERHEGLFVRGRYTIWATTSAAEAAGYARGARLPRARLWLEWRTKTAIKTHATRPYEALRRLRARWR